LVDSGQYRTALAVCERLHERGRGDAALVAGALHSIGGGDLEVDLQTALWWFRKSASLFDNRIARIYSAHICIYNIESGSSKLASAREVVEDLSELVSEGDPIAQILTAYLIDSDKFGMRDQKRAMTLYRATAAKGFVFSKLKLSQMLWRDRKLWQAMAWRFDAMKSAIYISSKVSRSDWRLFLVFQEGEVGPYKLCK
jgi:TPR repeat protein